MSALALIDATPSKPLARFGACTAIEVGDESAGALMRLMGYDPRTKLAVYLLHVINHTHGDLACAIFGVDRDGSTQLAFPVPIHVRAQSEKNESILVRVDDFEALQRTIVDVRGAGLRFMTEAPAPVLRRRFPRVLAALAATLVVGAVALAGAIVVKESAPAPARADVAPVVRPVVVHERALPSAQVTSISVEPLVAHPGDFVHVSYGAIATGGQVELRDAAGTIWGQVPISHLGSANLRVPSSLGDRDMRVLVNATRGPSHAQSVASFFVKAPDQKAATPDAPATSNGTFAVLDTSIHSGGIINVRILTPRNGMRIAVADQQSHEVAGIDVGVDQSIVHLPAPVVHMATRYVVVASFEDGFGQESVVEPVTIAP